MSQFFKYDGRFSLDMPKSKYFTRGYDPSGMGQPLPENNPYKQINNYQTRLSGIGVEPPERKPQGLGNVLMGALDLLQRPQYMVTNTINELINPDKYEGGVWDAIATGVTGARKTDSKEIFGNLGWQNDESKKWYQGGNLVRNIAGFVGDIVLDPTTYISAGGTAFSKGLSSKSGKEIVENAITKGILPKEILEETGEGVGKKILNILGNTADHIANKDDIKALTKLGMEHYDDAVGALGKVSKSRAGLQRLILPGFNKKSGLMLDDLSDEAFEGLIKNLGNVSNEGLADIGELELRETLKRMMPDATDDVLDAVRKATTPDQIRVADALSSAFNTTIEGTQITKLASDKALEYGKTFVDNVGKNSKTASKWFKVAEQEIAQRGVVSSTKKEIQFANGLMQVYDDITNQWILRFMGKDVMNMSSVAAKFGKPATKGLEAIMNFKPVERLTDGIADLFGYTFNPNYISRSVKRNNPEMYKALQGVRNTVTTYLRKETGIPHYALNTAVKMFDEDILTNQRIRRIATYFIEGGDHIADDVVEPTARKFWNALKTGDLSELSPQLVKVAQELGTVTEGDMKLLNTILAKNMEWNSSIYKLESDLWKISKYDPVEFDQYIKHAYKGDPVQNADRIAALTGKQKLAGNVSKKLSANEKRQLKSLALAIETSNGALNPVDDVLSLMSMRYLDTWRVGLRKQLTGDLEKFAKEMPEMISTKKAINLVELPGFTVEREVEKIVDGVKTLATEVDHFYGHPEVAQQLKRISDLFVDDRAYNKWVQYMDKITNTIKTLQTGYNPSFTVRNLFGETLMNFMADVSLESHDIAHEILKEAKESKIARMGNRIFKDGKPLYDLEIDDAMKTVGKGKRAKQIADGKNYFIKNLVDGTREQIYEGTLYDDVIREKLNQLGIKTYNLNGKMYTADEILRNFYDQGLGWSGITKGNLVENVQNTLKKELKRATGGVRNPMAEVGDYTETWTRLSHMIDRLQKGLSVEDAANDVRKFHVDYRDLTPMEREVFRRVMPYYTYMRKNVPIQMRTLLTQPGKFAVLGTLVNSSYEALGNPQTPDYLKENLALPLFKDDEGNVTYLNWNLPMADLARLKFDIGEAWGANVVEMLHPLIKAPFEISGNQNFALGMPIERYEGEQVPITGVEGSPEWSKQIDYLVQQLGVVDTARRSAGAIANEPNPNKPVTMADKMMLGSLLPTKSQRATMDSQAYQYRDQLQELIKNMIAEQDINVPTMDELDEIRKLQQMGYIRPQSKYFTMGRR